MATNFAWRHHLSEACAMGLMEEAVDMIQWGADVNAFNPADINTRSLDELRRGFVDTLFDCPMYQAVLHDNLDMAQLLVQYGATYIQLCPINTGPNLRLAHGRGTFLTERATFKGSLLELAVTHSSSVRLIKFLLHAFQKDISFEDMMCSLRRAVRPVNRKRRFVRALLEDNHIETVEEVQAQDKDLENIFRRILDVLRDDTNDDKTETERLVVLLIDKYGQILKDKTSYLLRCENYSLLLFAALCQKLGPTVDKLIDLIISLNKREDMPACRVILRNTLAGLKNSIISHGEVAVLQRLVGAGLMDKDQHPDALFLSLDCTRQGANVEEMITWLVTECGINPSAHNCQDLEPIHVVLCSGQYSVVQTLAGLGVDINGANHVDGLRPLDVYLNHCLGVNGSQLDVQLIHSLVSLGADLGAVNGLGYTALSSLFWLVQKSRGWTQDPLQIINVHRHHHHPLPLRLVLNGGVSRPVQAVFSHTSATRDRTRRTGASDDDDDQAAQDRQPAFLVQDNPVRGLVQRLCSKFGLELLTMGADQQFDPQLWGSMEDSLHRAGISWGHAPSLRTCCWTFIRRGVGGVHFQRKVDQLPLPIPMKDFLKHL